MSRSSWAMRAAFWGLGVSAICASIACEGGAGSPTPQAALEIEIGIPDKDTRRMFLPLEPGGDIFYFKGLQVEDFVMLAVRVQHTEPEAFVAVEVEDEDTGAKVTRPAWKKPDPLECTSDGWCTLVPVLLPARELGELSAIDGAQLSVHCEMWLESGARGEATAEGRLRPQQ
jgi:hypothetical protein